MILLPLDRQGALLFASHFARGATLNRTQPLSSGVFTPGVKINLIRAVIRINSGAEEAQSGLLTQPCRVGIRGGAMKIWLAGGADKPGKEVCEGSGLPGRRRREKIWLECRVWGRGVRDEIGNESWGIP